MATAVPRGEHSAVRHFVGECRVAEVLPNRRVESAEDGPRRPIADGASIEAQDGLDPPVGRKGR